MTEYKSGIIYSPLKGTVVPLAEVADPVFSQKILGEGIAIEPQDGVLYAPVNGIIAALFPTNHAVGIMGDDGAEILLHIGIDTVDLNGEGFTAHVKQGDRVEAGQKLVSFQADVIKSHGFSATTMIVISNYQSLGEMKILEAGQVSPMQPLIEFAP